MWFFFALLGYFLLAVVFILDKFILTKAVGKPVVYTFYSTIFMFGTLLAWPLGVELLRGSDWTWALVSGVAFGLALWTLFIAVKTGEASHINPFNGAIITTATFGLSAIFLGERLSATQLLGMAILIVASFILSFETSRQHRGWHMGFVWAIVSGILFGISHVSAKYLYEIYPFLTGFVWTRATTGLVGLAVLFAPAVRQAFKRTRREKPKTQAKRPAFSIVIITKALAILAVILIQYAMAISSVSLVAALSGLQFALMFGLVFVLTKFAPRIFKEYFTKQELAVQTVGIMLVMMGSVLLVF